jgi:hypothetical protein
VDAAGAPRTVGVEIELGGLDVDTTADIVRAAFGGEVRKVGPQQLEVVGTELGRLEVELDSRFLKQEKHRELFESLGIEPDPDMKRALDDLVLRAASKVVPCEIVTAPLRFEQLARLEVLRERLHEAGAEGTGAEPWYAFGVHFNPSLPAEDGATLHAYLQAFCLLEDWIREADKVDIARRISPFIDAFPESYRDAVLVPGPPPSRREVVQTYLRHNPTRNRGLDMLPAFRQLEPDLVDAAIDDALVKPRPTFHYRLADCRVDEPDWRLATEWASWVAVERLAADQARREDLVRRGVRAEG